MSDTQKEILSLMPDIRRAVASVLRSTPYSADDDVNDCMGDLMTQLFDYGVRTFDPAKGSAKSHFTCFAVRRAKNWLNEAHRRREVSEYAGTNDDGESVSIFDQIASHDDTFSDLAREQETARIRAAIASLDERSQALIGAFYRHGSWGEAAKEIGISPATASRMKAKIIDALSQ